MSSIDRLADEKMSEEHVSLDVNENHCQETVVGYPVNSKWFFWSSRRSSHETKNETNVHQHPNDETQSKDLTKRLLNDETPSNNRTHRPRGRTNRHVHARSNSDRFSYFDINTWTDTDKCFCSVILLLLVLILVVLFPLLYILNNPPPPLNFTVISLDVSSMTLSNNASVSDIRNYMSANLNLTLSVSNLYHIPLYIEHLVVSIKYFNETISSTKIGPLYEKSRAHEIIQLQMGFKEVQLQDATFDSMLKDLAINRTVEFTVIMQSKYDTLAPGHVVFYVGEIICEGSPVQFSPASDLSSGTMAGGPRSCKQTTVTALPNNLAPIVS